MYIFSFADCEEGEEGSVEVEVGVGFGVGSGEERQTGCLEGGG